MSKNTLDINQSKKGLEGILKYHYFAFIVIVLGGVIYAFFSISSILNMPTDENYRQAEEAKVIDKSFDTATIQKLETLNYSSDPGSVVLPPGRINPFSE